MRAHRRAIATTFAALFAVACDDAGSGQLGTLRPQPVFAERLDFGEVPLGTQRRLELVIENDGDDVLDVARIVPDDDFVVADRYRFAVDTAGFQVPIGQSVSIDVDFTPLADEEVSEQSGLTIEWNSDVPGRVALVGRGVGAQLEIDPEPLDFGGVLWGSTRTATLTITSRHDVPVEVFTRLDGASRPLIQSIEGSGTFTLLNVPDPARGGALTPPGTQLQPNQTIDVAFRYTPEPGADAVRDQARWTVATCTPAICGKPVPLVGTPRPDAFDCEPAELDFGAVNPGEAVVRTSTCTNVVTEPVVFRALELASGPEGFALRRVPQAQAVEPGERIAVSVEFDPPAFSVGNVLDREVRVRHEKVGGEALRPTRIRAVGRAGRPTIELSTDVLRFEETAISTVARRSFTILNRGSDQLSVTIERADPFRASQDALQIPAMSSVEVGVTFSPIEVGPVSGTLRLTTNDPRTPALSIAVSGTGSAVPPCSFSLTPTEVPFGFVPVGETVEARVTISNPGPGPCLVNDFQLETASPGLTLVDAPSGARPLEANTSTAAVVRFTPAAAQRAAGMLSFYVSSTDDSTPQVLISGRGVTDPLIISPNPVVLSAGPSCAQPSAEVTVINPYEAANTLRDVRIDGTTNLTLVDAPTPPLPIAEGQVVRFRVRATGPAPDRGTLVITTPEGNEGYRIPIELDRDAEVVDVFEATPRQLDLLFVVSDNRRMDQPATELPGAAQRIVSALGRAGIDYQLGVVRGRVSDPSCPAPRVPNRPISLEQGICGYLADGGESVVDPAWRVIDRQTVPTATIALSETLVQPRRLVFNQPELFGAVRLALVPPLSEGWNAPLRRPSAALGVVLISADDNTGADLDARALGVLLRALSDRPVAISSVSGPRTGNCFRSPIFALGAPAIADAVEAGGGTAFSLCDVDWATPLVAEGLPLLGHKRRFNTSRPAQAGTFEVRVDGAVVPAVDPMTSAQLWTGSSSGVAFTDPPAASRVELRYQAACNP